MKTIVVSGGQSNIGKTSLVLALCRLLPGAVAVKLGHGTPQADKPGVFYRAGTDFGEVMADHPDADWLVIESNRILEQMTPDLAIYLPSDTPKPSAQSAADKADLTRGVPADETKINNLAHRSELDTETIRRICWLCGARPGPAAALPTFQSCTEASKPDLATRDDILQFIQNFYGQLLDDPVAAPVFAGIEMQSHIPKVVDFWESLVFGGGQYRGSPFEPHRPLGLTSEHFTVWYGVFCSTLDDLFEGPQTTMIKERARSIAFVFSHKLGLAPPAI
jgi:hemoglobin